MRVNIPASVITTGTSAPSANGILTSFNIAHGLSYTPSHVSITAKNILSTGYTTITWDGTNITISYAIAPAIGSLSFSWGAIK